MKVIKRGKLTVQWTCPYCGSILELEKKDVKGYHDLGGDYCHYVKCCVCNKTTDVDGNEEIGQKLI